MSLKISLAALFAALSLFATSTSRADVAYSFSSLTYSGSFQPGSQLNVVATLTASAAIATDSVCVGFTSPDQYNFGPPCQSIALNAGVNTIPMTVTIPANAEINSYNGTIAVFYNNPWTQLAQSSTLATLSVTQGASYTFSSLKYSGTPQPGNQLSVTAVLTASAAASEEVCVQFTSPNDYNFKACPQLTLNAGPNTVTIDVAIPADAEIGSYAGTVSVHNANPNTLLAQSPTLASLTVTQGNTFSFSSLTYTGVAYPGGQLNITAVLTASAAANEVVCVRFTGPDQYNFGPPCQSVALAAGNNTVGFNTTIPLDAEIASYTGTVTVYNANPWTQLAGSAPLAQLHVNASSVVSPPVLSGNGAILVWQQDFTVTPLALRTGSNPTAGVWEPDDMSWQSPTQGYVDFAATPCAAADVASGVCNMAGGTFDINPNDPTMLGVTPFSQAKGYLTISASLTPANLIPAIQAEMKAQGVSGLTPSFIGGHLAANPAVFPGFNYGYFEFRAMFPNGGHGMFPALWFYSTPGKNPNMPKAEIDLLEYLGDTTTFSATIYSGGANNNTPAHIGTHSGLVDGAFHTYGMDWTAQHIDFYVDQQLVYSAPASFATAYQGVSLEPIMDYVADVYWMASNVNLQANSTTPNPLIMGINYVRLYNKKPF
jgi:hypothetical protein